MSIGGGVDIPFRCSYGWRIDPNGSGDGAPGRSGVLSAEELCRYGDPYSIIESGKSAWKRLQFVQEVISS